MLDHPILRKELLTRLRSRKAFVALGVWIILNGGAMSFSWAASHLSHSEDSGVARTYRLVRSAFYTVTFGQLLLVAAVAPGFAVGAFTTERKQGTHDLLLTTPIRPISIAFAKLLSCACVMVFFVVSSLPALSMVLLFGGVTGTELLLLSATIVTAIFYFSAIGLCFSAWCKTTARAALATYLVVGLLLSATLIPNDTWEQVLTCLFADRTAVTRGAPWIVGTSVVSPLSTAICCSGMKGARGSLLSAVLGLPCQGLTVILLALSASRAIKRTHEPSRPCDQGVIADETVLQERRARFPYYLIDPLRRKGSIPDRANPIFVREVRTVLFRSASTWIRVSYGLMVLHLLVVPPILALTIWDSYRGVRSLATMIHVQSLIVMLLAPVMAAGAVTREREARTLDMLRVTAVGHHRVLWGKTRAALLCGLPVLGSALLAWLLSAVGGFVEWEVLAVAVVSMGGGYALAIAACVLVSVLTSSTGVAFPIAYGVVILLYLAPVVPGVCVSLGAWRLSYRDLAIVTISRAGYLLALLVGATLTLYGVSVGVHLRRMRSR